MNKILTKILNISILGFLFLLFGCTQQPAIEGIENNPLSDFVGNNYKSEFDEILSISKENNSLIITYDGTGNGFDSTDTKCEVIKYNETENGTLYLVKCTNHSNWSPSQYPNYAEENPHENCYTILCIRSISKTTCEWAFLYSQVDGKGTSCFSSSDYAEEFLDFSKSSWTYFSSGSNSN